MEYYIVILVAYAIILLGMKFVFLEIEGRQARKMSNIRYFLKYDEKFGYRNQFSVIFVAILCYVIVSLETTFSTMWFLQLIGFVAVGVISDALSQVGSYYYGCFRFKKDIQESKILKIEIEEAIKNHGDELMQQTIPSYDSHQIIQQYFQEDKHLAVVSVDGGEFTSQFQELPPITYSVELNPSKAREKLEDKGIIGPANGSKGREILAAGEHKLPVDTSLSALAKTSAEAERFARLEERAGNLYALALDKKQPCGAEFTSKTIII